MCPAVVVGDLEAFLSCGGGALFAGCVWHGVEGRIGGQLVLIWRDLDVLFGWWGLMDFFEGLSVISYRLLIVLSLTGYQFIDKLWLVKLFVDSTRIG